MSDPLWNDPRKKQGAHAATLARAEQAEAERDRYKAALLLKGGTFGYGDCPPGERTEDPCRLPEDTISPEGCIECAEHWRDYWLSLAATATAESEKKA